MPTVRHATILGFSSMGKLQTSYELEMQEKNLKKIFLHYVVQTKCQEMSRIVIYNNLCKDRNFLYKSLVGSEWPRLCRTPCSVLCDNQHIHAIN
jgi:hypothetical protein